MNLSEVVAVIGPALAGALENKGFTTLTKVQSAVLSPELRGRDLRIASQTGSGKTVAIGLLLRDLVASDAPASRVGPVAQPAQEPVAAMRKGDGPRVLVIEPTRELARQVERELGWLYAPIGARVISVAGGAAYRDELRALAKGPAVVVGTPGRLLDHVNRGAVDLSEIAAVVLDESDSILDLGFRDDLESILASTPASRHTHLVSATFAPEVRAFADRVQRDPVRVEGTPLGSAHTDIEHVLHLVEPRQGVDALVNVLLAHPDEQMIVFVRTRADVTRVSHELSDTGFVIASLSGEMEQSERNRALSAFRMGKVRALIATDVAARGIDVPDIARVVHLEPPGDPESYTHRSGRTGRAGRRGTSSTFVDPSALGRTVRLLRRAGVTYRIEPIPTADEIRQREDDLALVDLTSDSKDPVDPRTSALALRIASAGDPVRVIERLLARWRTEGAPTPREVEVISPPQPRPIPQPRSSSQMRSAPQPRSSSQMRSAPQPRSSSQMRSAPQPRSSSQMRPSPQPRSSSQMRSNPSSTLLQGRSDDRTQRDGSAWIPFRVTWGARHGADPRRLLASVCRRGAIRAADVGSIHIGATSSVIEISAPIAASFAEAASKSDARDPRVRILPFTSSDPPNGSPHGSHPHAVQGVQAEASRPSQGAGRRNDGRRPSGGGERTRIRAH